MENIGFKYNWGKFYWDAWLNDINLQSCDLAAQGLWINLIAIMHKSDQVGYLVINGRPMTVFDIAKRVGIRKDRTERLLKKLIDNDVCSVNEEGVLYCRRIVREEKRRYRAIKSNTSEAQLKKGDNQLKNKDDFIDYRHEVHGEQNVIKSFFLDEVTKEKRKNIDIKNYMDNEDGDFKACNQKKYDLIGSRLPQDWFPDDDGYQYAIKLHLCPKEIIEDFRDYWHAKVGKEAIKMDWNATWRRWCRVANQWKKPYQKNSEKKKIFEAICFF